MENITNQTIFDECELIIIDANEQKEKSLIDKYLNNHKNIKYFHFSDFGLSRDPGIYGCWNLAINESSGNLLTNANIDDSRASNAIEIQRDHLLSDSGIDLVYYRTLETDRNGETFNDNSAKKEFPCMEYSFESLMMVNSPHCQPMWRKSLHDKLGFFNETLMSAGDYEMWLRASKSGCKMKKINEVLGLYYRNPEGVSSGSKTLQKALREVYQVKKQYSGRYI